MALDDSYSKALLHFDGSDASTTFTDESGKTWTPAANAQIDTAQSKFGGASGLFDGTGDYLSSPDHADWAFGAGNFTIDVWIRFGASVPASANIVGQFVDGNNLWGLATSTAGGKLNFFHKVSGSYELIFSVVYAFQANTWTHIAVVRSGNTWYMFVDGVEKSKTLDGGSYSATLTDLAGSARIGSLDAWFALDFNGWMDELRISKGVARWTANFTPPTGPYPVEDMIASATLEGGMSTTPAVTPDYLALTTYLTKTSFFTE